jgi:hypothetical protein
MGSRDNLNNHPKYQQNNDPDYEKTRNSNQYLGQ